MNIEVISDLRAGDGHAIPAVLISAGAPKTGIVVFHPYGSTKEHMLGMCLALAGKGFAALAVDLCGHGDNSMEIGSAMRDEVEAAVRFMRRFGRVGATGISLGGRLALMSTADCIVSISPAVVQEVSPLGKWMFENFPSPGVREPYSGYAVELLDVLGPVRPHSRPCLLLLAQRDIPSILASAPVLAKDFPHSEVRYITTDLRPDVQHDSPIIRYLPRWYNHTELKFNRETLNVTADWFVEHLAGTTAAAQRA